MKNHHLEYFFKIIQLFNKMSLKHGRHGFGNLRCCTFDWWYFSQHMLTFLVNKSSLKCRKNMRKWWFWAHFMLHHRQHWSTCVDQSCVDQKYDASAFKNRVERVSIIPRSFYNFLQRNNVFSGQSSAENRPMSTFSVIFSTMRSRGVLSISATKRYHISPQNPKYSTGNTSSFIPPQGHL